MARMTYRVRVWSILWMMITFIESKYPGSQVKIMGLLLDKANLRKLWIK